LSTARKTDDYVKVAVAIASIVLVADIMFAVWFRHVDAAPLAFDGALSGFDIQQ
jgi:hypothetical protein